MATSALQYLLHHVARTVVFLEGDHHLINPPAICLTQHISVWQQGYKTSIHNNPLTEPTDNSKNTTTDVLL